MSADSQTPPAQLLDAIANLARFHREHELFYSQAPLRSALELQAFSRALKALAAHWSEVEPADRPVTVPAAGAEDLNAPGLIGESGILFMEGEGEPPEIARLKREARAIASDCEHTGAWLAEAMSGSWQSAGTLVKFPELTGVLAERHRIISNDWRAARMSEMIGRVVGRALEVLGEVDFSPPALREDLAGPRRNPSYLYAASELLDHAADLFAESATLVHDNERRWRVFAARVQELR